MIRVKVTWNPSTVNLSVPKLPDVNISAITNILLFHKWYIFLSVEIHSICFIRYLVLKKICFNGFFLWLPCITNKNDKYHIRYDLFKNKYYVTVPFFVMTLPWFLVKIYKEEAPNKCLQKAVRIKFLYKWTEQIDKKSVANNWTFWIVITFFLYKEELSKNRYYLKW